MILVAAALAACGADDGGPTGDATVHGTDYDYTFDLDTRLAHSVVTVAFDTPGNCVTLPSRSVAPDPKSLRYDGHAVSDGALDGMTVRACGGGHQAGETATIALDSTVPLATLADTQAGYSVTDDSAHDPFTYMLSWVNGCDQFGPCDNRPDQFATYHFHVTHPETLMVRCVGTVTERSPAETDCEFPYAGGPTYSAFMLAAMPRTAWPITDKGMWGSAHVTIYDRPTTTIAAKIDATYHAGFVAWMESTFGPYPYGDELRVLTAPTYFGGFEHPGNIVIADSLAGPLVGANALPHTLNHEMAHQWAGDQTTLASTNDFVWKEAMAEYLAFVYEDMTSPTASLATAKGWKADARTAAFFPVPDEKPALIEFWDDVYGPGPLVLFRQLEVLSSRAQVIAALQSVLGTPRALSVDELVAALAQSTGLDLTDYAAAWIHGSGAPVTPTIIATYSAGIVHVVQTAAVKRRCKFHVALHGAAATEVQLVAVDTFHDGIDQMIATTTPAFAVTSTEIDPLAECLVTSAAVTEAPPRKIRPTQRP